MRRPVACAAAGAAAVAVGAIGFYGFEQISKRLPRYRAQHQLLAEVGTTERLWRADRACAGRVAV
jgi:hypothetical protein